MCIRDREVLGRGHQVFLGENARIAAFDIELLVDLVAADAADVVALRVEEETLEQGLGVGDGWRITGTETAVNVLERLLRVVRRVLLERCV